MRLSAKSLSAALFLWSCAALAQQVPSFPAANLPLTGAEVLYLVQNGVSKQTPVSTVQSSGTLSGSTLNVTGNSTLNTLGLSGKLTAAASSVSSSGLNLPQGTAPSVPSNGDIWTTSAGLYAFINGSTVGPFGTGGGVSGTANNLAYWATTGTALSSLATANSGVLVTSGAGVPSISTTLPAGLTIGAATMTAVNVATSGSLPVVTAGNAGQMAFVTNCLNGSQTGGGGTGCLYLVNNAGSWQPMPLIPTTQITIGGQAIYLGGATTNQGTGSKIATATGSFTTGDCVNINSNGAFQDAGGACTTGGGGGTVTSATANYIAYYASTGTTVTGLAAVNNAVLGTNGSGVPSESTTLPSSLTIPSATVSNPAITGTGTYVNLTGSGKLITAASTTSAAGLNLPAGTAPTSPVNGDMWATVAGVYARINNATVGPFGTATGTVSSIATTGPIGGGTITTTGTITCTTCATTTNGGLLTATSPTVISAAGVISCPTCTTQTGGGAMTATAPLAASASGVVSCSTCATTTNGGSLTATSPMTISAAGVIALSSQTGTATLNFDSNTTVSNNTYYLWGKFPYATGSISSVSYLTGGSSSPSFNIAIQVNGVNVTTCNGITVSSGTIATTTCGTNSITSGQPVTLVISATSGSPSSALVQVNYSRSAS